MLIRKIVIRINFKCDKVEFIFINLILHFFNIFLVNLIWCVFMGRSFSEIMSAGTFELNSREVKIQAIGIFLLGSVLSFFSSLFLSPVTGGYNFGVFLGLELMSINGFVIVWFRDKVFGSFDIFYPEDYDKAQFNGILICLFFLSFSFFLGSLVVGLFENNLLFGLSLGLILAFPLWVMFVRRNYFVESTMFVEGVEGKVRGFRPVYYWLLGIFCGFGLFGYSFNALNSALLSGSCNYLIAIFWVVISFIFEFLIVSPDLMNRFFPWELKMKEGFNYYFVFWFCISYLVSFVLSILV